MGAASPRRSGPSSRPALQPAPSRCSANAEIKPQNEGGVCFHGSPRAGTPGPAVSTEPLPTWAGGSYRCKDPQPQRSWQLTRHGCPLATPTAPTGHLLPEAAPSGAAARMWRAALTADSGLHRQHARRGAGRLMGQSVRHSKVPGQLCGPLSHHD